MTAARQLEPTPPVEAGGDRLLDIITELLLAGPLVAHDDPDFHRAHIAWEYRSGQWVMEGETGVDGGICSLHGWMSWYRCSPETLKRLAVLDLGALMALGTATLDLTAGPCLYIATTIVTPWAPDDTLVRLARAVYERNPEVPLVHWHNRKPDGSSRLVSVPNDLPERIAS